MNSSYIPDKYSQIFISPKDIYDIDGIQHFKFCIRERYIITDVPCELTKVNNCILKNILGYCGFSTKNLKKKDMINIIKEYKCIVVKEDEKEAHEKLAYNYSETDDSDG